MNKTISKSVILVFISLIISSITNAQVKQRLGANLGLLHIKSDMSLKFGIYHMVQLYTDHLHSYISFGYSSRKQHIEPVMPCENSGVYVSSQETIKKRYYEITLGIKFSSRVFIIPKYTFISNDNVPGSGLGFMFGMESPAGKTTQFMLYISLDKINSKTGNFGSKDSYTIGCIGFGLSIQNKQLK